MTNTKKKLPNGEAVREFYSSLNTIEEYYWEKGYRKKAYLYRTLKEKLGWQMSLESFKYHFKRAFESNKDLDKNSILKKSLGSTQVIEEAPKKKTPIITRTDTQDFFKTAKDDIPDNRRL